MSLIIFILLLVALILVHEFGHFAAAKLFGIRVDEFGIFFPPRLLAFKKGETEYSLNALPFGGFVKIFGENAAEGKDNPRSFAHKPRMVQAAVVVAGIVMNLVFAWLILSAGYLVGLPTAVEHAGFGVVRDAKVEIVGVVPGSPAQVAGVAGGDTIVVAHAAGETLDTRTLNTSEQAQAVHTFLTSHQNDPITLTIMHNKQQEQVSLEAKEGVIVGRKALGVELSDVGVLQLPPHLALLQGAMLAWDMTRSTAQGLGVFFATVVRGVADWSGIAGPIGIATLGTQAVNEGFAAAVTLTALISINLALINVIPIPGLDGGRLLFIAIEGVLRRPISPRLSVGLTVAGFAFLIGLMVLVSYHDITKLIG